MRLKDGSLHTIIREEDLLELIGIYMGEEVLSGVLRMQEEYDEEIESLQEYVKDLESQIDETEEELKETKRKLRKIQEEME
ncbi:hypothetical protein [Oribacterium sp. Sow4_G1_1]|uniref:hypothetical protein n=1 Tax=Oribacterium sp. Sow4_G1_1 TaxID=3438794 RepID=UPI003F995C0C